MPEAEPLHSGLSMEFIADSGVTKGQIVQLKDGRAGVATADISSGDLGTVYVSGLFRVEKTASIVILEGGEVYWDYSANKAHFKAVNDRDFYLGVAAYDSGANEPLASASANFVSVALNVRPSVLIDVARDMFRTAIVGTQGLNTMGVFRRGGGHNFILSSTNEAQKLDILSVAGFATGANAIVEFIFAVVSDGAGTAVDVSVGVANGTDATNADSITESVFMHLDANNTTINFESDDGTVEVAATDSTKTYTEGFANVVHVWMDMRNAADVQIYVDGVKILPSTVFDVSTATGPWKLLAHIEKSSSTDTYEFDLHQLRVRIAEK